MSGYAVVIVAEQQLLRSLQHHHLQRFVFRWQKSRSELCWPESRLRLYDWPLETALLFLPPLVLLLLLFLAGVL